MQRNEKNGIITKNKCVGGESMVRKTYSAGGLRLRFLSDAPILDAGFFPLFRTDDAGEAKRS